MESKESILTRREETSQMKKSLLKSVTSPRKSPERVKFDQNVHVVTIPNRKDSIEPGEIVDLSTEKEEPLPPLNALSETFLLPKNSERGPLHIKIVKKIGSGGYGEVYRVAVNEKINPIPKFFPKNNDYALKRMININKPKSFEYEQEIMSLILKDYPNCAPHVLCYFDISKDREGRYYFLSEMMDGDMFEYIHDFKSDPKKEKHKFDLAYQVAEQTLQGLKELQKIGLIHRDLKPENLLYKIEIGPSGRKRPSKINIRLADFGWSCFVNNPDKSNPNLPCGETIAGTPGFVDPKVWLEIKRSSTQNGTKEHGVREHGAREQEKKKHPTTQASGAATGATAVRAKAHQDLWNETNDIYSLAVILYEILFNEYVSSDVLDNINTKNEKEFISTFEDLYKQNSKKIEEEMKKYGKKTKTYKLLEFILKNIQPFQTKQTINEAIEFLSISDIPKSEIIF
jgi:hypothetical protein